MSRIGLGVTHWVYDENMNIIGLPAYCSVDHGAGVIDLVTYIDMGTYPSVSEGTGEANTWSEATNA